MSEHTQHPEHVEVVPLPRVVSPPAVRVVPVIVPAASSRRWEPAPRFSGRNAVAYAVLGGCGTAVAALSVVAVVELYGALTEALAWLGVHLGQLGAVAALATLLVLLLGGGAACAGLHCPGCRR